MPDLSEMLGAVYGGADESTPDEPAEPAGGPAWADDDHLDRAFAEWTPGPGADAPAAERSMFAPAPEAPARLADDLAAALSEAVLAETDTEDEATDAATPARVPAHFAPGPSAIEEAEAPRVEAAVSTSTLADLEPEPEPEPAPVPIPVHKAGWQRSDDDIIPTGRSARGRGGSPIRVPKRAKGPKPAKVEAAATPAKRGKAPKAEKVKAEKPKGKGLKREISFSFGKKK